MASFEQHTAHSPAAAASANLHSVGYYKLGDIMLDSRAPCDGPALSSWKTGRERKQTS